MPSSPPEYVANNFDNWHKRKGYTSHSRIMQDFITGNNLTVMDFMYNQDVKYTYFNIPRVIRTWIDHVISAGVLGSDVLG